MNLKIVVGEKKDLDLYQLCLALQIEYVMASLRSKIYYRKQDKEYYLDLMEKKKAKILDITGRNNLRNIFSDPHYLKGEIEPHVINKVGPPTFHYNSFQHSEMFKYSDYKCYYSVDSVVSTFVFKEKKIGKVVHYQPFQETLQFQENGSDEVIEVRVEDTTRIL